jgi:HAD superfamily hydrolase (TIGR01549 family)
MTDAPRSSVYCLIMEEFLFLSDHIKAVFFDLDGTLRHNLPSGGEFFASCAMRLGLHATAEDRLRAMRWEHFYWANSEELLADRKLYSGEDGEFWNHYAKRQLAALGASTLDAAELAPKVTAYMLEAYRPESVVPEDAMRLLSALKQSGYKLALISNREKPYQEEIEALGLSPFFALTLAGGEIKAWKPEPEIFLHACQHLDVRPEQAMYVGDNYFADVVGSRRAGLQPVLYDPRGTFPDPGCAIIKSFDELLDLLNQPSGMRT